MKTNPNLHDSNDAPRCDAGHRDARAPSRILEDYRSFDPKGTSHTGRTRYLVKIRVYYITTSILCIIPHIWSKILSISYIRCALRTKTTVESASRILKPPCAGYLYSVHEHLLCVYHRRLSPDGTRGWKLYAPIILRN